MNQKPLRVALTDCPAWDVEFPPYGLALVSAILGQRGYKARAFDFNRHFFEATKDQSELWDPLTLYNVWLDPAVIDRVFEENKILIEEFVSQLAEFEVIGFRLTTLSTRFSAKLAELVRKRFPDKFLVAGGPECSRVFNPDWITSFNLFDAVCTGDAETSFPELLGKLERNEPLNTVGFIIRQDSKYQDFGDREIDYELNDLPYADFSFLPLNTEKTNIATARGCVRNCRYCPERARWTRFRWRSAESIADEMTQMKERFPCLNFIYFNDDLINGNLKEFEKLCDLLIERKLGIQWGGHCLVREGMNDALIDKMAFAGVQRLNLGIESGSDRVLKLMHKYFDVELALKVLRALHRHHVSFSVNIIVGFPGETEEDFQKTCQMVEQIREMTDYIYVNPCLVLKGSDMYSNPGKHGIFLPKDFVTGWYTLDKTNTEEIRMSRARRLLDQVKATKAG